MTKLAKHILRSLTFGGIEAKEAAIAKHIPYLRHVEEQIVKTKDRSLVLLFKPSPNYYKAVAEYFDIAPEDRYWPTYGALVKRNLEAKQESILFTLDPTTAFTAADFKRALGTIKFNK